MTLPDGVTYATITGTMSWSNLIGTTSLEALAGAHVTFTPRVGIMRIPDGGPIIGKVVPAHTDDAGVLIDDETGNPGVELIATDNPDMNPNGWTWLVTITPSTGAKVSFDIFAYGGQTIDIGDVVPVPATAGHVVAEGVPGPPNVLSIGTVTTADPGDPAAATITGTSPAQVLDLVIPQGEKGDPGDPALGVPAGGTTGQLLAKASNADHDDHWIDPPASGVTQVNGQTGDVTLAAADVGAATAAQGAKADSAVQPGALATVATTGAYGDLSGKPAIPSTPADIGAAPAGAYVKPGTGIPSSDMTTAVQSALGAAGTAYQKPGTGVPKSDLAAGVQSSLDKADSALQSAPVTQVNGKTGAVSLSASDVGASPTGAYVKPGTGVPKSDLATAVQTSLDKADAALSIGSAMNPHTSASDARNASLPKNFWQCSTTPTNWVDGDEWIVK